MSENLEIGKIGEQYAEKFLISQNYLVITKNFYSRFGEIDLVALDQTKNQLVFMEVKARTSDIFGQPEDSFTYKKQVRMLKTISHFLNFHTFALTRCWRIDLIAIKLKILQSSMGRLRPCPPMAWPTKAANEVSNLQFKLVELKHYKNIAYGN